MNLSELLIIFVNKVLITQTKDLLSFMSRMNSLIRGKINKPGDSKVWRLSVLLKNILTVKMKCYFSLIYFVTSSQAEVMKIQILRTS